MYKSMSFEETCKKTANSEDEYNKMQGMRKGPWTVEEDSLLINSISSHGEGHWSSLAYSSGLRRSGKSCRLRWLNYLRPDVRRGNITLQEQLLILELHSLWGNRWAKIAEHLPGRTDNEIKNYWRTRVQKQAKQLKCDVNSKQFSDAMRHIWMPRLAERIHAQNQSLTGHHMRGMGEKTVINVGFESGLGQADPTLSHEMSGSSSSSLETQVSMVSYHNDSNNFPCGNDFFEPGFGPELVADSYAMQQEKDGLGYENMLSDEDILSLLQQCDYEV